MMIKLIRSFLRSRRNPLMNISWMRHFLTWDPWVSHFWSQEGEDILLNRIFGGKKNGFYVDVGAHHPMRFSNTHFFYRKGWSGINIDAMPGSMEEFEKYRRRDINLELGVAQQESILDYYAFNDPALNSFSAKVVKERNLLKNNYHVIEIIKIKVKPLREILAYHLKGRKIDFLNVDVEGFDLDVLKSNDWSKYRPRFVLAEILSSSLHNIDQNKIVQFMREQGYATYAKLANTVFFEDLQVSH